jgi:hypothetical protein
MSALLTRKSKKLNGSIIGLYTKKAINVFTISGVLLRRHSSCAVADFMSLPYFKNTIQNSWIRFIFGCLVSC